MCFDELNQILNCKKEVCEISEECLDSINLNKVFKNYFIEHLKFNKIIVKLNDGKSENIEKVDPYQLIQKKDDLHQFITSSYNKIFLNIIMGDEYLYHVTKDLSINSKIIQKHKPIASQTDFDFLLKSDIELLKEHDILTSRLAVIVYRVANLEPFTSTTKCGRYFREKVGSKSKAFSHNQYKVWGSKYAVRAYDLNVNEIELETKKRIAKNLIDLKMKKLDKKKISEVTNLSIDEINKL